MTAKSKIDWSPVSDNSSSTDAVLSFASGESLRVSSAMVWDPKVKKIFSELRKLPVELARERARSWARRQGYSVTREFRRRVSGKAKKRRTYEFYEEIDLVADSLHNSCKEYKKLVDASARKFPDYHSGLLDALELLEDVIVHTSRISSGIMKRGGPHG